MWAPVVEVLPGPAWFGTGAKLGYIVVVRLIETVLGNIFLWSGSIFYSFYAAGEAAHDVSPLRDQGWAGTVMMLEGSLVTLGALAWLFLRLAAEGELKQELIERGRGPAGRPPRGAVRARRRPAATCLTGFRPESERTPNARLRPRSTGVATLLQGGCCGDRQVGARRGDGTRPAPYRQRNRRPQPERDVCCDRPACTTWISSSARLSGACRSTATCSARSVSTASARSRGSAARPSGT